MVRVPLYMAQRPCIVKCNNRNGNDLTLLSLLETSQINMEKFDKRLVSCPSAHVRLLNQQSFCLSVQTTRKFLNYQRVTIPIASC